MQEDEAIAAMRAGAHDYLSKNKLERLIPAVERELREVATAARNARPNTPCARAKRACAPSPTTSPAWSSRWATRRIGTLGFQYLSEAAAMLFGAPAEELIGGSAGWMTWLLDEDLPGFIDAAA
jgi:hypothetical protein